MTSEIRNAKAQYFEEKLAEVKSAAACWNLIERSDINPVRRNRIGPLKREDGSLIRAYSNQTKRCNLCIAEKYFILTKPQMASLNRRNELISTCRHRRKYILRYSLK